MTTHKTVEERVKEFEKKFVVQCADDKIMKDIDPNKHKNWLRTTIQDHEDQVRREERDRIAALCYKLDTDGDKMYNLIFNKEHDK